ncbi:MAG: thiamine pyrophosphate-binding protein [Elusimicrobiota bacterium]
MSLLSAVESTPPAQRTQNAVGLLLKYLEAEGVGCVFGIPGGPLMPLYEAMFASGSIRPIITKHEEGAAFMADGYARVSGRLGVCCTTTGPGATNALTGIACSYRDSVPVMLLTAQISTAAFGKGAAQESSPLSIDIVELYKSVTKASAMLVSAEKMNDMARQLLRSCLSGRPGPVHFNLPADMMKRLVVDEVWPPEQYRPQPELFDRRSVREAAGLLLRARRPAILAGYGTHISGGSGELIHLAERLSIPVATTPKAKGVFPENHPLSLGVFGLAGSPQADAFLLSDRTDLLLAIGTSMAEASTHAWDHRLARGKDLLQIDIDPSEIGKNYRVKTGLVGDVKRVLMELGFELEREIQRMDPVPDLAERVAAIRECKREHPRTIDAAAMEDASLPYKPQRVIAEMRRALPEDAIVFVDIGNVMAWALHYFEARAPGSFYINMGFGSMGHGVSAAIGGKLAAGPRPVVALVGDGAFAMNGMEIHTAVEHDIPVVWVVMNNGGHGMVHLGETRQFHGKFHTALFKHALDVCGIARALGALAYKAEVPGDVEKYLHLALAANRPAVIEVCTDINAFPPATVRIETLERFFNKHSE